jgi:phage shock protein C
MGARRTRFYLDKRNARFLGVCAGIADYTGIEAIWVRVAMVLLTVFALGPVLPLAYLVTAWLADQKPLELYETNPGEARFWQGVRASPSRSIRDVRSSFRDVDRRLRDIERYVTSSNSRLATEIEQLR